MRSFRLVAAAALLCTVSACAGAEPPEGSPDAPAAVSPAPPSEAGSEEVAVDDEAAVETAFTDYNRALAEQDAAAACALSAPETVQMLVAAVSQQLGQQIGTCEEAFGLVFSAPGATELAQRTASTTEVRDVVVDGDTATVSWSAEIQEQRQDLTNEMRRVDGRWLIVGAG